MCLICACELIIRVSILATTALHPVVLKCVGCPRRTSHARLIFKIADRLRNRGHPLWKGRENGGRSSEIERPHLTGEVAALGRDYSDGREHKRPSTRSIRHSSVVAGRSSRVCRLFTLLRLTRARIASGPGDGSLNRCVF